MLSVYACSRWGEHWAIPGFQRAEVLMEQRRSVHHVLIHGIPPESNINQHMTNTDALFVDESHDFMATMLGWFYITDFYEYFLHFTFGHVDARNACWTHLQTAMLFIILQHRQHSANLSVSISLWASKQQLHFWRTTLTYMNELNELVPSYWVKLSLLSNLHISFPIKLLYTWVESSCLTFNCKSGVVFQRGGLTGMSMCRHISPASKRQAKSTISNVL